MTRIKALLAVLTAGLLAVGSAPVATADDKDNASQTPTESGHKPGYRGWNSVELGDDINDTRTDSTHICAGRTLLYQAHVDAIYATRNQGKMDVMIVDGQVPRPADDICLRLAPDADKNGKEISRFVVPDEKALSFLGKPGTILWNGPQSADWTDNWRPLWAGIGAFDPAHEYEVPGNFEDKKVHFELVDFEGPGEMETFFASVGNSKITRILSTRDNIRKFSYTAGYHGHFSWTFTKPGIYKLNVQAHAKHTDTGEIEKSPVRTVTWLVGSDEEVGLPEGTTKGLREITETAEQQRDAVGLPAEDESSEDQPSAPSPSNPDEAEPTPSNPDETKPAPEGPAPANPAPNDPPLTPAERNKRAAEAIAKQFGAQYPSASDLYIIDQGHMDLALASRQGKQVAFLKDGADPQNVAERASGTFGFRVDSEGAHLKLNSKIKDDLNAAGADFGDTAWVTPAAQEDDPEAPWLGFSTEAFAYPKTKGDVELKIVEFDGPGDMVTAHSKLGRLAVELNSKDLEKKVNYPASSHDHHAFLFSKPGVYRVVFEYSGTDEKGKQFSVPLETFFAVGNTAGGESPSEPAPGGNPGEVSPGDEPNGNSGHWLADGDIPILEFAKGVDGVLQQVNKDLISLDNSLTTIDRIANKWFGKSLAVGPRQDAKPTAVSPVKTKPHGAKSEGQSVSGTTSNAQATANVHAQGAGQKASAQTVGAAHPLATSIAHGTGSASGSTGGGSSSLGTPVVSTAAVTGSTDTSSSGATASADSDDAVTEEAAAEDGATSETSGEGLGIRALPSENSLGSHAAGPKKQEKSAIQLFADQLQQGGWMGGFTLGVGLMALLGGMLLVLLASRNLRTAQEIVLAQRVERADVDED